MKIICGCCKKIVDTEKHDFCPKCGANFNYSQALSVSSNAQEYEKHEEKLNEQRRNVAQNSINNPKKTAPVNQNTPNGKKKSKGGCCAGCFVALIIFLSVGFVIISDLAEELDFESFFEEVHDTYIDTDSTTPDYDYEKPDESKPAEPTPDETTPDETDPEDDYSNIHPDIIIFKGETAEMENYSVTCNKVSVYENKFVEAPEGSKYISFDLSICNITETNQLLYPSLRCFADGEACTVLYLTGVFFPGELEPGEEYNKSIVFEVPEDAVSYELYINNSVGIFTTIADVDGYEY